MLSSSGPAEAQNTDNGLASISYTLQTSYSQNDTFSGMPLYKANPTFVKMAKIPTVKTYRFGNSVVQSTGRLTAHPVMSISHVNGHLATDVFRKVKYMDVDVIHQMLNFMGFGKNHTIATAKARESNIELGATSVFASGACDVLNIWSSLGALESKCSSDMDVTGISHRRPWEVIGIDFYIIIKCVVDEDENTQKRQRLSPLAGGQKIQYGFDDELTLKNGRPRMAYVPFASSLKPDDFRKKVADTVLSVWNGQEYIDVNIPGKIIHIGKLHSRHSSGKSNIQEVNGFLHPSLGEGKITMVMKGTLPQLERITLKVSPKNKCF